ncbi:hypothetical protein [Flavobacterium sp.]|uniref:hypothetical protein n=1 Tax=Flavobacterium sp. TaxID=239 RepID=UPI002601FF67|nr:hypothetical protein [Flavobacterium sp.]
MEKPDIKILLDKYFEGETTIAEENYLRVHFASADVTPEFEMYKPVFGFFEVEKSIVSTAVVELHKKQNPWLSIAVAAVVFLCIGSFGYLNFSIAKQPTDLGTYDNPQKAFQETKKALALLSVHVNTGVESMQYLQTYESTKNIVFN